VSLLDFLKPAVPLEPVEDPVLVRHSYRYWRWRIFYGIYSGYALYYFTRKSLAFLAPALIALNVITVVEWGQLATIQAATYGISKFVSGVVGDRSNPRYFMGVGLVVTGIANLLFGFCSSFWVFAALWAINGWFQGWGWPGCAKLLTHWYGHTERGTWWGFWNTSHNVGGIAIAFFTPWLAMNWGWQAGMWGPGIVCVLGGLYLINRLRDTPQSLGLPEVEVYRGDAAPAKAAPASNDTPSTREILVEYIFKNRQLWLLGAAYFFIYVVRQAVNDWTAIFLVRERGYSLIGAGSFATWFELGGVLGSLAAGWLSDKVFLGRRGPVNIIFCAAVGVSLAAIWWLPNASALVYAALIFAVGFLVFGPQMLVGVAAAETGERHVAATATGFIGTIGYLGAAAAGAPLGWAVQHLGWQAYYLILLSCSLLSALLLLPLWGQRSSREAARESDLQEQPAPVDISMTDSDTVELSRVPVDSGDPSN